jgi:hypothetical protein
MLIMVGLAIVFGGIAAGAPLAARGTSSRNGKIDPAILATCA